METVRVWGGLAAFVAALIWTWPYAKAFVNEQRCEYRLGAYLRRVVPASRGAEVDKCRMPDAAKGYCLVSSLTDDGARRTDAVPVSIARASAFDVKRFLDDERDRMRESSASKSGVVDAFLDHIIETDGADR